MVITADKLNFKQRLYVTYFTSNPETKGNAYKSAKKAGYSERTAQRAPEQLSRNIKVKAAIVENLALIDSKDEDSRDFIDNEFMLSLNRCKSNDNEIGVQRCLENMGKNRGYYATDNSQKQPQTANIAVIESEEALDRLELELIQKQKELGNALCEG